MTPVTIHYTLVIFANRNQSFGAPFGTFLLRWCPGVSKVKNTRITGGTEVGNDHIASRMKFGIPPALYGWIWYISLYISICIRWRSQGSRFGWIPRKSLMMIGLMMSTVRIMRRFLRRKSWSPFLQKKSSYVGCKVFTWWLRWRQPVEGTEIGHPLSCVSTWRHSFAVNLRIRMMPKTGGVVDTVEEPWVVHCWRLILFGSSCPLLLSWHSASLSHRDFFVGSSPPRAPRDPEGTGQDLPRFNSLIAFLVPREHWALWLTWLLEIMGNPRTFHIFHGDLSISMGFKQGT